MLRQVEGGVVESRDPTIRPGNKVLTSLGWQLYGTAAGSALTRIDPSQAPASYYLGLLGMPGMTAWFGLFDLGQPENGGTVRVSAASGAVGSVVGQLAKSRGCRAVGIAGGQAKCRYVVDELGFDACVDYKAGRLEQDLRESCPNGVDVNFENVGGALLDTVLRSMNLHSGVGVCGGVAEDAA